MSRSRLTVSCNGSTLELSGELDAHGADHLRSELVSRVEAGDVDIDLAEVNFMDSSGLRVLIEAHREAEEAGHQLKLRSPSRAVLRVLELSGVAEHLNVIS